MTQGKETFGIIERGAPNSVDYRIYFKGPNGPLSPFHDIPIYADQSKRVYNMVVEIPRWTNAKMEISTKERLNPIKQDMKKGKLRYVDNCFPHHGYIWNYGAIPQTWENPSHIDSSTKAKGDNDPVDVCEIGHRIAKRGEVIQVKILGTFALIDEGETDWKILCIDVRDPLAEKLHDIDDIEKYMPGFLKATHEWFKIYKIPAGKPENTFAFSGEPKNREFATRVVEETHKFWTELVMGQVADCAGLVCDNVSVAGSKNNISQQEATSIVEAEPPLAPAKPIPESVDMWHYVKSKSKV